MKRNNRIYTVKFRRRREGKTNYKSRLSLLISESPRLVIRKSSKNISVSVVDFDPKGDKVIVSASSQELKKSGCGLNPGNIPSAYLTGFMLGKKAKEKNIGRLVLDIGLVGSIKGSRIYSALAGVLDSGVNVPHDPKILPSKDRIKGKHIKKDSDASATEKEFERVKKIIEGGKNG